MAALVLVAAAPLAQAESLTFRSFHSMQAELLVTLHRVEEGTEVETIARPYFSEDRSAWSSRRSSMSAELADELLRTARTLAAKGHVPCSSTGTPNEFTLTTDDGEERGFSGCFDEIIALSSRLTAAADLGALEELAQRERAKKHVRKKLRGEAVEGSLLDH